MYEQFVELVRDTYQTNDIVPLHEPRFTGNEKHFLNDAIDSTFVSSIGAYVDRFEQEVAETVNSKFAVSTVNGTAALHTALILSGTGPGDQVLTQSLSFVATCNAISYCQATPIFLDIDRQTLGLSASALQTWLLDNADLEGGRCINRNTGKAISACVPMHTFGNMVEADRIKSLCEQYRIPLLEDAAEALGSQLRDTGSKEFAGTIGDIGVFSFNGNKIITTGGGGMVTTNDPQLAARAKHLTTTAKAPHRWEFSHDELGYNYRMPNLNAALGCAQLQQLNAYLESKRRLHQMYAEALPQMQLQLFPEPQHCHSNCWLNAIVCEHREQRDQFLEITNDQKVLTRPVWQPLHTLPMYAGLEHGELSNTQWFADRLVNIPSSVPPQTSAAG
ncbi:MAG: LegC family aminotransferase [Pseudomonadales bacterium]